MTCPDGERWTGEPCGSEHTVAIASVSPTTLVKPPDPPGGAVLSSRLLGGRGVNGSGVAVDATGATYLTGSFVGRATFGELPALVSEGGSDAFVIKLDPSGEPVWQKRWGGTGPDSAQSVVVDAAGNVYVSGDFESPSIDLGTGPMKCAGIEDLFLTKLDKDGNVIWAKRYGDAKSQVDMRLRLHPAGGVVATGWHNGTLDFGTGPVSKPWSKAFFVASIDADGKGRWADVFGRRSDYATTDSAVDSQGRVLVSAGSDVTNEFIEAGRPQAGAELGPALLAFDGSGKRTFAQRFGEGAENLSTSVSVDAKDGARLAVASRGVTRFGGTERRPQLPSSVPLVLTSFDAAGAVVWSKEVLAGISLSVSGSRTDAAGNTYVAGQLSEQLTRGSRSNGFVVKVTPAGDVAWTRVVADGARAWLSDLAFDPEGRVVVTGSVAGVDGQNRVYVARIQP